jgi:hypothetical protein
MVSGMSSEPIEVIVASLEEAEAGIAEFWIDGTQFGHTLLLDGELVLRIEPRSDGQAWEVDFHALRRSLDRALELLRSRLEAPETGSRRVFPPE